MGVIRGLIVVIVSVLLFLSLFSVALFGVLSSSLNYETVQQKSAGVIRGFLEDGFNLTDTIDNVNPWMQLYCRNNSASEYVFNSEGYTFDIPCEIALQGTDAIINEGVRDLIHKVYYTEYECDFFDCFKESPFFLVSEKADNFVNEKFYFFILASILLTAALFFFIEKKTNTFIVAGALLIISALIFIKIDTLFSLFSDNIFFKLLGIFFSESFSISVQIITVGIVLLAVGIILKIFKIGFKLEQFISKLRKPEVAEKKPKKEKASFIPQITKKKKSRSKSK